jgi:A/G-specific adenine glycosylase
MASDRIVKFVEQLLLFYSTSARHDLPWRAAGALDPYAVIVSELMLQQTQVTRVVGFFNRWMELFPTVQSLATAPVDQVLRAWQGLGYNRRALYLHRLAQIVVTEYQGIVPKDLRLLRTLPGVGPYVAGIVLAFVWNSPQVVIETNIRRVYIHEFFADQLQVSDSELLPLIEQALAYIVDTRLCSVRDFYYALMDYGSTLPKTLRHNPNIKSVRYTKQSRFAGSRRQVRGQILRALGNRDWVGQAELLILSDTHNVANILEDMESEGFIERVSGGYRLKK